MWSVAQKGEKKKFSFNWAPIILRNLSRCLNKNTRLSPRLMVSCNGVDSRSNRVEKMARLWLVFKKRAKSALVSSTERLRNLRLEIGYPIGFANGLVHSIRDRINDGDMV